jgi:hypothetical protein
MITKSYKKRYQDIIEENYNLPQVPKLSLKEFQKRKSSLLSELTFLLTTHHNSKNEFINISKLIISTLNAPEKYFFDKIFSFKKKNPFENFDLKDYLITIKKVSSLLKHTSYLPVQKILENCSLERFFIKLFLKDFLLDSQSAK